MIQIDRGRTTAIILAAGSGSRMGCDIPKQRISLLGESILHRSVRAFSECRLIDSIVVVVRGDELDWAKAELADVIKIHSIVSGGATRAESARAGFRAVPDGTDFVAIHDGARCLVTDDIICRVVEAAFTHKAATACVEVTDTVKTLDGEGMINGTVARARLRAAQTPQVFGREVYARAILALDEGAEFTDDNSLLEALGERIYPVICDKENIKITTAEDIAYAEYILKGREQMDEIRIGHGYDVHRLAEGRRLILGGVDIPFEKGLVGHSDADVLTHAIMDALLGACGLGDIGRHFPDNDQSYKDISSLLLLDRVRELLLQEGIKIVNIDATLVLQQPKIAPFVDSMRENISKILKIEQGRINIKATTEEGLGFTGRGEGVCAYAVASVEK